MDDDPPYAQRPDSIKKLRACKTCKLIKTYDQVRAVCSTLGLFAVERFPRLRRLESALNCAANVFLPCSL